jgi:hypothetical protein
MFVAHTSSFQDNTRIIKVNSKKSNAKAGEECGHFLEVEVVTKLRVLIKREHLSSSNVPHLNLMQIFTLVSSLRVFIRI